MSTVNNDYSVELWSSDENRSAREEKSSSSTGHQLNIPIYDKLSLIYDVDRLFTGPISWTQLMLLGDPVAAHVKDQVAGILKPLLVKFNPRTEKMIYRARAIDSQTSKINKTWNELLTYLVEEDNKGKRLYSALEKIFNNRFNNSENVSTVASADQYESGLVFLAFFAAPFSKKPREIIRNRVFSFSDKIVRKPVSLTKIIYFREKLLSKIQTMEPKEKNTFLVSVAENIVGAYSNSQSSNFFSKSSKSSSKLIAFLKIQINASKEESINEKMLTDINNSISKLITDYLDERREEDGFTYREGRGEISDLIFFGPRKNNGKRLFNIILKVLEDKLFPEEVPIRYEEFNCLNGFSLPGTCETAPCLSNE